MNTSISYSTLGRLFTCGLTLSLCLCTSLQALAQARKEKLPTPSGTRAIAENLFMSETETTVAEWVAYMNAQQDKATPDSLYKPDSFVVTNWKGFLTHERFADRPMVSITYHQAVAYCAWRSQTATAAARAKNPELPALRYRLPTPKEWTAVAQAALGGKDFIEVNQPPAPVGLPVVPVRKGAKSMGGFYYLLGNVAEMTSEPGIAKGGSWHHGPSQSGPSAQIPYRRTSTWLGFRYVVEYVTP